MGPVRPHIGPNPGPVGSVRSGPNRGQCRQRSSENVPAGGGGLKSLTVTVKVLSPDLLDTLAEKLPQLERLQVNFACLRTTDVQIEGSRFGFDDVTREVHFSFFFFGPI